MQNSVQRVLSMILERFRTGVSGAQKGAKSGGGGAPDFAKRANGGASAERVSRQTTS